MRNASKRYVCSCFFERNIFLANFKLHVNFTNEHQFYKDYENVLNERGCEDIQNVVNQVHQEIERRQQLGDISLRRKELIQKSYIPLHREIYSIEKFYLTNDFISIVDYCNREDATRTKLLEMIKPEAAKDVYTLPVFTKNFCDLLVEEIKYFENSPLPKGRPNTMNKSGILLEELGFYQSFMDPLREEYLNPISSLLYPDVLGEKGILDSQRAFIVSYKLEEGDDGSDESTELSLHYDNAEVTLNVSLSDGFASGELYFGGLWKEPHSGYKRVEHSITRGVLHKGSHMHGAMPLKEVNGTSVGERYNLIIWMRSSAVRNRQCPMCETVPCLIETLSEGDGFIVVADDDKVVQVCGLV